VATLVKSVVASKLSFKKKEEEKEKQNKRQWIK
jgi:hypothetical protein